MLEQKLKDYLNDKSKEDLKKIIISHYKFLIKHLEEAKYEYDSFLNKDMNLCAKNAKNEYEFIFLQLKWYEKFILNEVE